MVSAGLVRAETAGDATPFAFLPEIADRWRSANDPATSEPASQHLRKFL